MEDLTSPLVSLFIHFINSFILFLPRGLIRIGRFPIPIRFSLPLSLPTVF